MCVGFYYKRDSFDGSIKRVFVLSRETSEIIGRAVLKALEAEV